MTICYTVHMNITKRALLGAVSGFVGGGLEDEVRAAIRDTSVAQIREIVAYLKEDGEYVHPENVVYQIAAAHNLYW